MSKWLEKFKTKPIWLTLGLLGGLLMVVGVLSIVVINGRTGGEEVVIEKVGESFDSAQDTAIAVDVGGAVIKPGVYELKIGARVNDVLIISGGLSVEADRDWVEKNLNLAAKVTDGQKIYIPSKGETNQDEPLYKGSSFVTDKININTATIAELDSLWGVGEATARKIVDNRPYGAVEELLTKKSVKGNVYEAIKDNVSVY